MSISQYTHETEINFDNLETECKNLERQLFPTLLNKEEETEEMEEIWYNLCQKFGLILMESPAHAFRHDIIRRLWFIIYPKISAQRNRHTKIKRSKRSTQAEREEAKQTLKTFLQEYIVFYEEMTNVYLSLFDPGAFKDDIQGTDHKLLQECLDDADKPTIVPILYILLTTLGDLYRYQGELDKALHNYDMAAFLSPGQGIHHNQRAVLEMEKGNNCNALYYYARAIKASHQPFETSYKNMERFYELHKEWLKNNNQAGSPTRSDKEFKIRLFSALFVDLHRRLKEDTDPGYNHATTLEMDTVIREFESVLNGDVYSDKVLCMMVVINAFSASNNGALSQILTFRFGTALANFVKQNLSKKLETLPQRNKTIRGLLPLLLVCDYILTLSLGEVKAFQAAEEAFWTKVCTLINIIKGTEHSLALDESSLKNKLPKDYKDYEGFTPFENFISKPSKFTNFEDARNIVRATNSKLRMKGESTQYETPLKLAYLLAMTEKTEFLTIGTDGYYIFLRDRTTKRRKM